MKQVPEIRRLTFVSLPQILIIKHLITILMNCDQEVPLSEENTFPFYQSCLSSIALHCIITS